MSGKYKDFIKISFCYWRRINTDRNLQRFWLQSFSAGFAEFKYLT